MKKLECVVAFWYLIMEIRVKKVLILRQSFVVRQLERKFCSHFFCVADITDEVPTFLHNFVADLVV